MSIHQAPLISIAYGACNALEEIALVHDQLERVIADEAPLEEGLDGVHLARVQPVHRIHAAKRAFPEHAIESSE